MKNFSHLSFFILLAVFVNSCQEKVDLIVHNATVYTLDDITGKATAFVVDEGRFIAVGGDELINNIKPKRFWIFKNYQFIQVLLILIVIF